MGSLDPLTPVDPLAGVRAAAMGAPATPPPSSPNATTPVSTRVASTLVAANTKAVGITGWVLTIADFALVAVLPDLPASLRAHLPPLWADAILGALAGTAALLGRMVRYDGLPTP